MTSGPASVELPLPGNKWRPRLLSFGIRTHSLTFMDEATLKQIATQVLTPWIGRFLGWIGGALFGGAGITLTTTPTSASAIASAFVGALFMITHVILAKRNTKQTATVAFDKGLVEGVNSVPVPEVVTIPFNAPTLNPPDQTKNK